MQKMDKTEKELLEYPILISEITDLPREEIFYPILASELLASEPSVSGSVRPLFAAQRRDRMKAEREKGQHALRESSSAEDRAAREKSSMRATGGTKAESSVRATGSAKAESSVRATGSAKAGITSAVLLDDIIPMAQEVLRELSKEGIGINDFAENTLKIFFLRVLQSEDLSDAEKRKAFLQDISMQLQFHLMLLGDEAEQVVTWEIVHRVEEEYFWDRSEQLSGMVGSNDPLSVSGAAGAEEGQKAADSRRQEAGAEAVPGGRRQEAGAEAVPGSRRQETGAEAVPGSQRQEVPDANEIKEMVRRQLEKQAMAKMGKETPGGQTQGGQRQENPGRQAPKREAYPTLLDALKATGALPKKKTESGYVPDLDYIKSVEKTIPAGESILFARYANAAFLRRKDNYKILQSGIVKFSIASLKNYQRIVIITSNYIFIDSPFARDERAWISKADVTQCKGIYEKKMLTLGQIQIRDRSDKLIVLEVDNLEVVNDPKKKFQDYQDLITELMA